MIFIGNRSEVVNSTSGHSVRFEAGKETFVPNVPTLMQQCKDHGHQPKKEAPAPKPVPAPAPKPAAKRAPAAGRTPKATTRG